MRAPAKYKPTLLDRAIGLLNPVAGLRRVMAGQALTRAYLAAAPGDPWRPRRGTASANADHSADAATLRAKSRFLIQNVDYIGAGMDARVGMLVGTGISARWAGQHGPILQTLWPEWCKVADADGQDTYYGLQAKAVRAMDADGECLVRLRPRRPSDGLPVPLQIQVLEVDWLDTTRQRNTENDNQIIEGKEYDYLGRCVAYWLWDEHPGEIAVPSRRKSQSTRVDASFIIHLQLPGRPGAKRGFPRLSRCITRARDIQLLEDAELQRKNQEARLSVLASLDPSEIENSPSDMPNGNLGELASGGITRIPDGMRTTVIEPAAAPGFVDYDKFNIHMVCAGAGFTYEQATGDMTGVNFSSARIRIIDVRREIEQLQWLTIIPTLCDRVCKAFVQYAELAGKAPGGAGSRFIYTLEHSTPRWEYTSPTDEVNATLDEIAGGLTSFSESVRRRNDDPEVRAQELAEDITRFKTLGIWEDMLALRHGSARGAAAAQPAAAGKAGKAVKQD